MRNWEKFKNDEISALWHSFKNFELRGDPLNREIIKPIRLSYKEIINLVDELIDRLESTEKMKEIKI